MVNPKMASGLAGDTELTHLNTTGDNRSEVSKYSGSTFIFTMSYQVSDLLIKVLQDYFQATNLTRALNEHLAKVNKEVNVLDQFSPDTVRLPQIVVSSLPVDHTPISLGNRLGKDSYGDQLFDVWGGQVTMNATIEIYDSGKPNVHELADMVFLGLMQYVPTRMKASLMILDVTKVRFANANRVTGKNVGGEVYRIPLTIPIIADWRQYMEIETVDADKMRTDPTKPSTPVK